jgi:CII-binding regulator of phage lambda lysogenization HflD
MNDHIYKYKGFIEILTYPRGYRDVTLNNGYSAQWMVYEEVPDQDKLYYYEDLRRYDNVKDLMNKLKYSINVLEAKISELENKQAYYDNIMSRLKVEIKEKYANICTSFEKRITMLLN